MQTSSATVKSLSLRQFTAFSEATFHFSPGINVIIGANATGKSHLLKVIYTLLKVSEAAHQRELSSGDKLSEMLTVKLEGVFRFVEAASDLVRKTNDNGADQILPKMAEISLDYADGVRIADQVRTADGVRIAETPSTLVPELVEGRQAQGIASGHRNISCQIDQEPNGSNLVKAATSNPLPTEPACATSFGSLIYLPAQEFLSLNQGFISAYTKRESAFDETFYDLSLALNALPLRRPKLVDVEDEIKFLRELIAGEDSGKKKMGRAAMPIVTQENGRFYLNLPEGQLEAHLVAEGYRKMATLLYLLRNGELTKNSILFWDEPEANLNPKLVVKVAELLQKFATLGMQIFVTTHDYLLSHELSLLAEYPSQTGVEIKFFALHKPDRLSGVLVEEGKTLAEIEHNPILNEFTAHYDRELLLFQTPSDTDE